MRAPNPARQPTIGAAPRTLPPPLPTPTPTPTPTPETPSWPGVEPQATPDTTPLAPPAPAPSNFTPTPTIAPLPSTAPTTTPTPTDLESPSETPTNLADNPQTPPAADPLQPVDESKPTGWLVNGKPSRVWGYGGPIVRVNGEEQSSSTQRPAINATTSALAVAIPVVILDGLRQKVNTPTASLTNRTQPNPLLQRVTPPPPPVVNLPQPPTCIYERQRVMDIQNKATDVQQQASNPTSGFFGLYGIGIESRVKLGQTFDLLGNVNTFMRKAWETTRIQKVLNAMTLITVLHNASMISRDVGETLGYAISQGLDVLGIEDEEGNALDVNGWFGTQANNFFENLFGAERWHGLNETWNKANRIISSATMVVWTLRSIHDGTQEVLEWTAENTGKIGNALRKWGVVGEKAYGPMAERVRAQDLIRRKYSRALDGLETIEETVSSYAMVTSEIKEIQDEIGELGEQRENFNNAVRDLVPGAYPDNSDIPLTNEEAKANATAGPAVTAADMEPSTSDPT
ncbi:MAG: hypothetical protein WBA99_09435 [Nodosilinea sp.]